METGEIDMILNLTGTDKIHIEEASGKLKVIYAPAQRVDNISFNVSKPPFDNFLVRQACAYAINRQDILKAVFQNNGAVAYSVISPDIWGHNPEIEMNWPYKETNIEKAIELMKEAGYEDGVTVELMIDDNAFRITAAEIVKNQLAKIGITVNITSTDFTSWYAQLYQGTENMFLQGVSTPSGEPDSALSLRFHKMNAVDQGTNMVRWVNDEFTDMLDKARASFDSDEKLQYYARAQEIIMEELPVIPYYVYPTQFGAVTNLQGIRAVGKTFYAKDAYFD